MSRKAVTLIEIIVATVVLALVITGLAQVFMSGRRFIIHARSRMVGAELGRYFIDPLHMDVNQANWANTCLGGSSSACPGAKTIDGITYTPGYTVDNATAGADPIRRLRVTINWNEFTPN